MILHNRIRWLRWASLAAIFFTESNARAETVVTTYVTKVQEERKSTRFTLDEWLKTKDRMRLMDAWLAMVSDTKSRFRPEVNVEYFVKKGELIQSPDALGESISSVSQGDQIRGQLWLTNLISGTTGIRTLNVDLGASGMYEELKKSSFLETRTPMKSSKFAAASFRVFGKSTQDSTLTLSYGRHQTENNLLSLDYQNKQHVGVMASGAVQIYVTNYLGAEANYLRLGTNSSLSSNASYSAYAYDYSGFIEISLVRLQFGAFVESQRQVAAEGTTYTFSDSGYFAGVKMFL